MIPGLVFGPFLRFGNLDVGRAAAFAMFAFGTFGFTLLLRRVADDRSSRFAGIVATVVIAFSMPLVAYSALIYTDVVLFTVVAWAAFAVADERPSLAVALAFLLPLVHVRAFPITVGILTLVALQAARARDGRGRRPFALACGLAVMFVAVQFLLYGSLTGPAFSTTQPSFAQAFERFGFALFGVRQGLLTYAPCYAIAFAGLIAGAIRRNAACLGALVILAAYVFGFMWSDAGESWPARFWVAALPLLGIGLAYWFGEGKRLVSLAIVVVPIAIVEASNLALYAIQPDWFLENRRSSITYAILYNVAHVHFGTLLPIDGDPAYTRPLLALLAYATMLIASLTWYRVSRHASVRTTCGVTAIGLSIVPFIVCAFATLPDSDYRIARAGARGSITISPRRPLAVAAIQLDDALPIVWAGPGFPNTIDVFCRNDTGSIARSSQPSRALVLTPGCTRSTSIELVANPVSNASRFVDVAAHVTVMRATGL